MTTLEARLEAIGGCGDGDCKVFVKANARSPIVSGFAIGRGGEGAVYVLQNGQEFRLTAAECEKAAPRWSKSKPSANDDAQ
jgi:ribosomal protein L24E